MDEYRLKAVPMTFAQWWSIVSTVTALYIRGLLGLSDVHIFVQKMPVGSAVDKAPQGS